MKRFALWTGGIVVALVVIAVLAFRLSPWPSVAIVRMVFASNDAASEARLVPHVPEGIVTRADIAYGPGPMERLDLFHREGAGAQPALLWVHGGAWVAGSKEGVSNYLRVLAGEGLTTIAIGYSTGWGTAYPEPVRQVNAALAYVLAHAEELHVDPSRIAIGGSSAGAQISSQLAMIVTDADYAARIGIAPSVPPETIRATVLMSGAFDIEGLDFDGDYGWFMRTVLWAYSGVRDFMADEAFQMATIVDNVGAAFPPSFISSGNGDPLEPQAKRLAARLEELGVSTQTLFFAPDLTPPLPHEFQFNLDVPQGREALDAMVAFLRTAMP